MRQPPLFNHTQEKALIKDLLEEKNELERELSGILVSHQLA